VRVRSHVHVEQTLKYLEAIFEEMPSLARQRPSPAIRDRVGIDLDEDLFSPSALQPAAIADAAAPRERTAAAPIDLDDRPWPTLELPPQPRQSALEKKVIEQERELSMRCTQVADLYNLQERQAAELQVAHAEIERLSKAFAELETIAAQHAKAAAERKSSIAALHQENAVLRSQLEKAVDDAAQLSNQMLTVDTMFNDREMIITSALEQADLLKAQLAAATAENERLAAVIDETEKLQKDRIKQHAAITDELNRKLGSLFVDNGVQMKTRDKLARRCDELTKANAALESAQAEAQARLSAQADHTAFLETVLRVERETAAAETRKLAEKLEQESLQRVAAEQAVKAMRRDMAALLQDMLARRLRAGSDEPEVPARHLNAA
jgi:chromosome segregation ATPase